MPDDARPRKNINTAAKAGKRKRFDVAAVATSASRFKQEADRSAATMTLIGTISRLSPHLLALRAKGWSLPLLAAMVTEDGFPIDASTLGNYLRRLEPPEVADGDNIQTLTDKTDRRHEIARADGGDTPQTNVPTSPAILAAPDCRPVEQSAQVAASGGGMAHPATSPAPREPAVSPLQDIASGNFKATANRPQRRV
jgi:hypothetical protein